jgi:hypothetical protein
MAKEQNLALNPTKISGQCGRLLCCLGYEFETYCSLRQGLPKCGKRVQCGCHEGEVIKLDILNSKFTLKTDDGSQVVICKDEISSDAIIEKPKKPSREQEKGKPDQKPDASAAAKPRRDNKRKEREKERDKEKDKVREKP